METELEAKFLDIDPRKMRQALVAERATLVHTERLMRRKNFDYPDRRLRAVGGWVRVRDEGDKITLSYKQLNDRTLHGTKEIVATVDNFDKACQFLEATGLASYAYQETRRERWVLDGVDACIDTWPWILPFVEIEGPTEKSVRAVAKKLDLDWACALHGSVEVAYQKYFDVTEEEIDGWEKIIFTPVPAWLEKKRKIVP